MVLQFSRGINLQPVRSTLSRLTCGMSSTSRMSQALCAASTSIRAADMVPTVAAPRHPSFDLVEESNIEEYGCKAILYSHKKSGAQVMSVIAPDENKVFGITFRTPPSDSTGIPHILEHSVLCGSRKFPVKEPFVDLLRGSLQNFLNAFTYPDRTCYPVASTNTKVAGWDGMAWHGMKTPCCVGPSLTLTQPVTPPPTV